MLCDMPPEPTIRRFAGLPQRQVNLLLAGLSYGLRLWGLEPVEPVERVGPAEPLEPLEPLLLVGDLKCLRCKASYSSFVSSHTQYLHFCVGH
jgi:hypothetical protein